MTQWFYAKDGQQAGPVPQEELESLITNGAIPPDSLVWKEGMNEWQPASKVFAAGESAPAPASEGPSSPAPAAPAEPAKPGPDVTSSSPEAPLASTPQPESPGASPVPGNAIPPGTVNNYLWQSICCLVLCCWPCAIPALVFSTKVNPALERGDRAEAERVSAQAKKWCLISLIAGVAFWVIYLVLFFVLGSAGLLAQ